VNNVDSRAGFIPSPLYKKLIRFLPIASVEVAIQIGEALLYMKRDNYPAKGEWWFPGGAIKKKSESLQEALHREILEEMGLEIISFKLVNVYSRVFP
jgi:ADP-ribose pyrophosphatase YjhB (NUDIX family)